MKLDRNINIDGRGKYALVKLRSALIRPAAFQSPKMPD